MVHRIISQILEHNIMRASVVILFIFCFVFEGKSQNLVPNPDFNNYEYFFISLSCNDTIYKPTFWYNPTWWWDSQWYLHVIHNACIDAVEGIWAGVPKNMWAYRWPVSGDGYGMVGSSVARNSQDNNRNTRIA